jgi:aminopeptidase N
MAAKGNLVEALAELRNEHGILEINAALKAYARTLTGRLIVAKQAIHDARKASAVADAAHAALRAAQCEDIATAGIRDQDQNVQSLQSQAAFADATAEVAYQSALAFVVALGGGDFQPREGLRITSLEARFNQLYTVIHKMAA